MDGEIMDRGDGPGTDLAGIVDSSLAVGLSRAEIDTQIATARRYPRQLSKVAQSILSLATLDEETAEESMYALPRGGKPIQGPSIRFAEIVKTSYGNCRAAARVVHVDRVEKVVIAEGVFHDLETNTATRAEVRRRIVDKHGRLYKDDLVIVTGNAACSIALRNAILGGVPKALWRKAYEAVQQTIAGDVKTLAETRDRAIKALAHFGVTPEQVFQALGVGGMEDITIQHIPTLRGMFAALKNGEATVEEMFVGTIPGRGSAHERVENPLSDHPVTPSTETQTRAEDDSGSQNNMAQHVAYARRDKPSDSAAVEAAPESSHESAASTQSQAKADDDASGPRTENCPDEESVSRLAAGRTAAATSERRDVTVDGDESGTIAPFESKPDDSSGEQRRANSRTPVAPVGAPTLNLRQRFSQALARAESAASIDKIANEFWKTEEWPADHEDKVKILDAIKGVHKARAKGTMTPDQVAAKLKELCG